MEKTTEMGWVASNDIQNGSPVPKVKKGKSGKYIPYYIVAFFIGLAIVDSIFVYIAFSTHNGLVTDNGYKKGLEYNKIIERWEAQQELGWNSDVGFISYGNNAGQLVFSVHDNNGDIIKNMEVSANIIRPVTSGNDFSIALPEESDGVYNNDILFPLPGLWKVDIVAVKGDITYRKSKKLDIQ